MLDLALLLQQTDPQAETRPAAEPKADLLADREIILSLRLRPADGLEQRRVLGTIGIAGQMPQFIQGGVTFDDLITALRTLYSDIKQPPAKPDETDAAADSATKSPDEATTLTTAAATSQPSSMLDIF